MVSLSPARIETQSDRLGSLLKLGRELSLCCNCEDAKRALLKSLQEIVCFDYLHLIAFEKEKDTIAWQILYPDENGDLDSDQSALLEDGPISLARKLKQTTVIQNWQTETRYSQYRESFLPQGILSTCTFPLVRGQRCVGVVTFGNTAAHAFSEEEAGFLAQVADQLALVMDAAVNLYSSEVLQDRMKLILDLTNQVVSNLELNDLLHAVSSSVRRVMNCEAAAVMLPDEEGKHLRVHALDFPDGKGIFTEGALVPIEGSMPGDSFTTGNPIVINRLDPDTLAPEMYEKAKAE